MAYAVILTLAPPAGAAALDPLQAEGAAAVLD